MDKKSKVRTDLLSYWPMRPEFAVHDGLLLKVTSLVISAVLQRDILSRLHEAHQGIVKCANAREILFGGLELINNLMKSLETVEHVPKREATKLSR
jgi:hypothetical protein